MLDTSAIRDDAQYVIENRTEHNIELPEGVHEKDYKGPTLKLSDRQLGPKIDDKLEGAVPYRVSVSGAQLKALARRPLFVALVTRGDITANPGRALFVP